MFGGTAISKCSLEELLAWSLLLLMCWRPFLRPALSKAVHAACVRILSWTLHGGALIFCVRTFIAHGPRIWNGVLLSLRSQIKVAQDCWMESGDTIAWIALPVVLCAAAFALRHTVNYPTGLNATWPCTRILRGPTGRL